MKRAEIEANARAPYARRILQLEAEAATLAAALAVCARYIELEHSAHQEADDRSALNMARAALEAGGRGWHCPDCGTSRALATTWQPAQVSA